ncbi:MAG: hypothetical protein M1304_01695 [Candidatus Thermoplasmatota archaeon]|nr:hypothetical protein [Candidatus Thermoplasmatota archaeon]MCL5731865.1 hypothetical protein [Candidatus Thermoplasmatota archaeon]
MCRIKQPAGRGIESKQNFKATGCQPVQALSRHDAAMSFYLITLAHGPIAREAMRNEVISFQIKI